MKRKKHVIAKEGLHEKEIFHRLRTRIRLQYPDLKVLTILSHQDGDGKTTVSMKLAESYARANQRVLLIDGDMTSIGIAAFTGANPAHSQTLNDALEGQEPVSEYICPLGPQIDVLLSRVHKDSTEILENKALQNMIIDLKKTYDMILIDTPSLQRCIDGIILSEIADGVLYVLRSYITSEDAVGKDRELIQEIGKPLVGSVLMGV